MLDFLSFKMYPQVFRDFRQYQQTFGEIDYLPTPAFFCRVTFELNGQTRSVQIADASAARKTIVHRKAVESNDIGSPLMGRLASVQVTAGERVEKDQPLFVIEAMKMETTITAPVPGEVKAVHLQPGTLVEQGDLVVEFR